MHCTPVVPQLRSEVSSRKSSNSYKALTGLLIGTSEKIWRVFGEFSKDSIGRSRLTFAVMVNTKPGASVAKRHRPALPQKSETERQRREIRKPGVSVERSETRRLWLRCRREDP